MGAGASSSSTNANLTLEQQSAQLLSFFKHYIEDAVVEDKDIESSKASWKLITDDLSPAFLKLKCDASSIDNEESNCIPNSCLSWFYDSFYKFSSKIDVEAKALYKDNLKVQIKALVAMITTSLSLFKGKALDKITKNLTELSHKHYLRGVRAYQFPLVGEILLQTFELCLGEAWTEEARLGWAKIFSVMLRIIIPASLKEERDNNGGESSVAITERIENITQSKKLDSVSVNLSDAGNGGVENVSQSQKLNNESLNPNGSTKIAESVKAAGISVKNQSVKIENDSGIGTTKQEKNSIHDGQSLSSKKDQSVKSSVKVQTNSNIQTSERSTKIVNNTQGSSSKEKSVRVSISNNIQVIDAKEKSAKITPTVDSKDKSVKVSSETKEKSSKANGNIQVSDVKDKSVKVTSNSIKST